MYINRKKNTRVKEKEKKYKSLDFIVYLLQTLTMKYILLTNNFK